MKKFSVFVVGLVAVLAAAVFVLPGMIDWNAYRDDIAEQAEAVTGRKMAIDGDIAISLLPTPALVAHDVSMANIAGASAPTMARLKSLEIRISFGPLLGGEIQVEAVRMVEPEIELERLADGRVNWEFGPAGGDGVAAGAPTGPAVSDGQVGSTVRLDSFLIENGTVVFRDSMQGVVERLEQVNARLAAASLQGPLDSAGTLRYRGVPLGYEISLGRVIEGRTVPLNMIVTAETGQTKAELSGAVVDLAESPRFKGKMVAASSGLAGLIDDMFGAGSAPPFLGKSFRIEGDVQVSKDGLEMQEVSASLGEIRAAGSVSAAFEEIVTIDAKLTAGRIDLDAIMAAEAQAQTQAKAGKAASGGQQGQAQPIPDRDEGGFELPQGVNATVELLAEALTFNGGIVSEARMVASLSGGEITISQLSALLPGGSDVFATGFLTAEDGAPKFDGNVDAKISDLRRVLSWLGIEEPDVPSDRLRQASFKGRVLADSETIQGVNMEVAIDTSRITGGLTLALRKRLAFGANLKVDRINLDAYLEPEANRAANGNAQPARPSSAGSPPSAGSKDNSGSAAFLGFLNRFDSNLKLAIGNLTYHRVPLADIALDATLFGGALEVRSASIGDLAGAKGQVAGRLVGLTELPGFENVTFSLSEIDLPRLFRLFETEAPSAAKDVGVVSVKGRADGSILRPEMKVTAETRDGTADLAGRFSVLPVEPLFEGEAKLSYKDLPQFVRLFGVAYRPTGRVGGFEVSARLKGGADVLQIDTLDAKVGANEAKGTLTLDLTGARPRVTADIKAGNLDIDPFLPAQSRASRGSGILPRRASLATGAVIPAAWRPSGALRDTRGNPFIVLAAAAPWSSESIDLSALEAVDADLKITAASAKYAGITMLQAATEATVTEGVLRVNSLTGQMFGGQFKGIATVRSAPRPAITGSASLTGGDFGEMERTLRGERMASGNVGFRITFSTSGASEAEMVSALGGEGSFEIQKVELSGESGGRKRGAISGLLSGLDQMVGTLTGGGRREGLADISGTFVVDKGIARSSDLLFVSSAGEGAAKGTVNLPAWTMDVSGDLRLSQNLLSQILSGTTGVEVTVPFRLKGAVDEPDVVIETARLPGKVLKIPGQILDKTGVGDIIKKLIPR